MKRETIPVTILSGSLGAGKTTLLNHLLAHSGDRDIAVLVNDMGSVNIDAELIAEGSELELDDGVAELSNGCICCELQEDLSTAVVRLAGERDFDQLVVESSGISEPEPVARLFTTGSRAAALYDVDALVTVVDTRLFVDTFSGRTVPERRGTDEEDTRPLSDLLIEQIEFSNVVLLNKADLCTEAELTEAAALVGELQPDALVYRTVQSEIDPEELFDTGRFDPDEMGSLAGWKRAIDEPAHEADSDTDLDRGDHAHDHARGDHDHAHDDHDGHDHAHDDHDGHDHVHPQAEYGVSSFTVSHRRPFHPGRLESFLSSLPEGVIRSKGTIWVAGREGTKLDFSQAGPSAYVTAAGPWIAALSDLDRELYRSNHPELEWDDTWGDRRTALVFIGTDMDEQAIRDRVRACLLTEDEFDADWDAFDNPFPNEPDERLALAEPSIDA